MFPGYCWALRISFAPSLLVDATLQVARVAFTLWPAPCTLGKLVGSRSSRCARGNIADLCHVHLGVWVLAAQVQAFARVGSINEDSIEGIHASISRERHRARAAQVPWISASMCLKQNVQYVEDVLTLPHGKEAFCSAWRGYKSIVRPPSLSLQSRQLSNVKMSSHAFNQKV